MIRLILLTIVTLLYSCSNTDQNSKLSIFKYNESSGISTLDPAFAKDQATIWATNQLFNGLVQLDNNLNVKPSISKYWNISSNSLHYTFILRDDVYFHDHYLFSDSIGRKVIAKDFEYSFNRLLSKELAAPGKWVLSNVESYKAINDSTFKVTLKKPFPAFLSLLSMQYCSVVPHEVSEKINFSREPIGTGPFKLQLWKDGVKLVMRKNNNYFEKNKDKVAMPYLDAIAITFIKDKQSAFLQFLNGNLDFVSGIDASYKDEILTRTGELNPKYNKTVNLEKLSYLNTEYLGFLINEKTLPIEIRKAINLGFNRLEMIKYLRNNIGYPATKGIIPMGLPSFNNNINGYSYNPEKAKALIKKSNFDVNQKITLSTTSSYLDLCEYIQNSLTDIGLNVEIQINLPSSHRQMVATSKLNFFRGSWIADYPDAENYLSLFYSKNKSPDGPNYTHFSNSYFDSLYVASLSENISNNRYMLYNKMNQLILDSAVIVPLYYDNVLRFSSKNIAGLEGNAMNLLSLKAVTKNIP
jgi:peptide/nickel transport system substrate-binding protein